jgi:hypothetical protein
LYPLDPATLLQVTVALASPATPVIDEGVLGPPTSTEFDGGDAAEDNPPFCATALNVNAPVGHPLKVIMHAPEDPLTVQVPDDTEELLYAVTV